MKTAYKLGFDIGYYGHYETLGWIRRENAQINGMAKKLGVVGTVEAAYEKGKKRGSEMKRSRLSKGSEGNAEIEEEDSPGQLWERQRRPSPVHVRPMVLSSPGVIRAGEILDMPGILRSS